ncbi:MAG: hypothetical protein R3B54_10825 [Bdellovibrionota bacterium]
MQRVLLFFILVCGGAALGQSQRLSETGLYSNMTTKEVSLENRFYDPQYPLWTDGALKKRWIYLPPAQPILTQGAEADINHWVFPVGTKIWKEFAFETESGMRRVETRLIEKLPSGQWEFGTYVWDEAETDAVLAPVSGLANHFPIAPGVSYDIPSRANCLTCHRRGGDPVLGFDALQLSADRDPLSVPPTPWGSIFSRFRARA